MRREVSIAGVGLLAMLAIGWCTANMLYPPLIHDNVVSVPPATPEPFEPPHPEPEEDMPLLSTRPALAPVDVCCCGPNVYGRCVNQRMPAIAARQHAAMHTHDLFNRLCATERDEDWQLFRVLQDPEQIHRNTRNRLAMSDRSAYRERLKAEAAE